MSLEFEIKELRGEASVLAALETIEKKSFPKAYSWAGQFHLEVKRRNTKAFFARRIDTSEVAGYLVCTLNSDFVLITRVAVKASYRRKGLGLKLVLEAISHFHGKATDACLHVETSNKAAIALYLRAGFTIRAELKDYYRFGSHAYTMGLPIP
ncbi:hypothetical protein BSKO_10573 [Bryopsis sp. KO-2023]|nr:hypothetical protein BSKO_10573 [Bryopsis sp. KO-2023]